MSGAKRNADKLNTIGIVVVGICGAVLVYVSIIALQAFYMSDMSDLQTTQDYGGQDSKLKMIRADQERNLTEQKLNPGTAGTYQIPITRAMDMVVESAKVDPATLVPAAGRSDHATIQPVFGRPKMIVPAGAGSGAGSGSAAAPTNGSDAGSGSAAGGGSAAGAGSGSGSGSGAEAGSGAGSGSGSAAPAAGSGSGSGGHAP